MQLVKSSKCTCQVCRPIMAVPVSTMKVMCCNVIPGDCNLCQTSVLSSEFKYCLHHSTPTASFWGFHNIVKSLLEQGAGVLWITGWSALCDCFKCTAR